MNRRGFFGAMATLPFWRRLKFVAPAPAVPFEYRYRFYGNLIASAPGKNIVISGLNGWIRDEPSDFGVDRGVAFESYPAGALANG